MVLKGIALIALVVIQLGVIAMKKLEMFVEQEVTISWKR